MRRLTQIAWLRAAFVGLLLGCCALGAAAAFVLARRPMVADRNWKWDLAAAGVLLAAGAWLILGIRLAGQVAAALRVLRQRIISIIEGDLVPQSYRGGLSDLHDSFGQMVQRLERAQAEHEKSRQSLAERTRTVDRLLEFSQTIQGAGRVEQIFSTLCHFLQSELKLDGAAVLAHDPEPAAGVQARASHPRGLLNGPLAEFDTALCPCLRQNQPRTFRPGDSPVRCAIDAYLPQPLAHEAHCVPFSIGLKTHVVIHMLLPIGQAWTEDLRQLAQTYVNTAQSALAGLHLLDEAEKQSMTDSLTALYNRRSLDALLEREVALAERHQQPLSIVMIDMDYFKQINDAHGHAAGDHLLRSFADCVRITLRKTDLAFRYGGDEFVIALPQTPIAQAQQVVSKLRQAFASVDFSSAIAHLQTQPTLSIGVAERSAAMGLLSLASLLSAADQALYDAKTLSRNCVRVYQPPKAA